MCVCVGRGLPNLNVPVGEGMGETKGEVSVVSILRVCVMGEMGGGRGGGISSISEVSANLIWVDGNRMMHLQQREGVCKIRARTRVGNGTPSLPCAPHEFGNWSRLFSLFWKMSSTNTPFFPRHTR